MKTIKYPTQASITSLSKRLGLPGPDRFEQDWEYVVADPNKVQGFLEFYSSSSTLTDNEKFTLMIITIESINDALTDGKNIATQWHQLAELVRKDKVLHKNTLDKYANWDEDDLENCFAITPHVRLLAKSLYK